MKHREGSTPGVQWRLFGSFAVFTAVILALLWIFQVVLLDAFYKAIKVNEIKTSAHTICNSVNSSTLQEDLQRIALNNQICCIVCDAQGNRLYSESAVPNCVIHRLNNWDLAMVYTLTARNGGSYFERFPQEIRQSVTFLGEDTAVLRSQVSPEVMIFAQLVTRSDGKQLMVLLNSVISPVGATVETLRYQLLTVSLIMVLLGLLLAYLLSRKIGQPIEALNSAAKTLAKGDYEVRFEGGGYREVRELSDTLNYAAQELAKTERLQRDLVANISHDLRTPLTLITGYAEVMRDLPGENTPENVQIIIDEATRLTTLVNDVLDLSKLQAGVVPLEREIFNLTESVRSILTRYTKLTDYHIVFYAAQDVFVNADELKISQVVYNLVNNALTYTGADKSVTLRQSVLDGKVRIAVSDTGEGIPQEKLDDIWERYYKVDKAHKRAQVGTGLGLAIVKMILDMHGGQYGVQSREGVGSTFWFELDAVPAPGDSEPALSSGA